MTPFDAPLEIHIHGQVPLREGTTLARLQDALKPLWHYAGARSLAEGAASVYEEEPGIRFEPAEQMLQICWTVRGDEDFRQSLDDLCMNLNELAAQGTALEVSFFDAQYDDEDDSAYDEEDESRDDYFMLFVGPTPAAIMQVQRDMLVQDVVHMMERHFDGSELGGIVTEIDRLFAGRFNALVDSLEISRSPRGSVQTGHAGGRRPRRLH